MRVGLDVLPARLKKDIKKNVVNNLFQSYSNSGEPLI